MQKLWCFILLSLTISYVDNQRTGIQPGEICLTGFFTDIQSWALEDGSLHSNIDKEQGLDLSDKLFTIHDMELVLGDDNSSVSDILQNVYLRLEDFDWETNYLIIKHFRLSNIKFLSLARNNLNRIPLFQSWTGGTSGKAWRNLQFLTLTGNSFSMAPEEIHTFESYTVTINATNYNEHNLTKSFYRQESGNWMEDLINLDLKGLIELDLRNCSITMLKDYMFSSMLNLRRLYLADNQIYHISSNAFHVLGNLIHLDISKNTVPLSTNETGLLEGLTITKGAFKPLSKLKSLDFSHTIIVQTCSTVFSQLSPSVQRLSICFTKFPVLRNGMFYNTSIKYLDISGNIALEDLSPKAFDGIEDTLEVLYARKMAIKNMKTFENLKNLKVLSLVDNDIALLDKIQFIKLKKLQILDMENNRILPWNSAAFGKMKHLDFLRLKKNSLSLMTQQMFNDLTKIRMFSFGANGFVCNCQLNKITEKSLSRSSNEDDFCFPQWMMTENETDGSNNTDYLNDDNVVEHHNAYQSYSALILQTYNGTSVTYCDQDDKETNSSYYIYDYDNRDYMCTDMKLGDLHTLDRIRECDSLDTFEKDKNFQRTTTLVIVLCVLALLVFLAVIAMWKWWYIRYFFLLIKNAFIFSVINKDGDVEDADKVFNYDVFVSYCDSDREWILEHFLPHVEKESPIRVCLHERDFQVGLSILENIVSCIDRSRCLLMIVSEQFLMSQWCQFEMHLAQHRLLETRREQLILVLLENIPRKRRPNTLHYLMMTKTYIVWPKNKPDEQVHFWKRLKRAILYQRPTMDKVSHA